MFKIVYYLDGREIDSIVLDEMDLIDLEQNSDDPPYQPDKWSSYKIKQL